MAVDEDIGPNGEVHYRILPPSADDQERVPFELDTNSGALRTKEKVGEYSTGGKGTFVSKSNSVGPRTPIGLCLWS